VTKRYAVSSPLPAVPPGEFPPSCIAAPERWTGGGNMTSDSIYSVSSVEKLRVFESPSVAEI
jgi:hypothetical protein